MFGDERLIMTLNEKCVCALYDEDPAVQAGAAEGYAKLLLHRILHDPAIITGLLHLYFSPSTATNPRLRQTLTYFLQAFAYSSSTNQSLLAKSTLPILQANNHTTDGTLTFNQIAGQLIELTDPARLVATTHDDESNNDNDNDKQNAHAELAEELAWAALRSAREPEGRQFASLLGKLSTVDWPIRSLKRLLFVVGQLIKVTTDRVVLTGLKKLVALLVELDDPTVLLEAEDLIDLREKMTCVEMPEKSVKPLKQTTTTSSRPIKPSTLSTVNIMEEIDDLLD